jgi:hypothetical protein
MLKQINIYKYSVFILIIFLFTNIIVSARETNKYDTLLEKLKKFDKTVNFKELRIAYAGTGNYNPYNSDKNKDKMFSAYNSKKYDEVIKYGEMVLNKNYVDIDAHFLCSESYKKLNNNEKSEYHNFVTDGLINSILSSGDGKTPKTAFQVINLTEEEIILALIGLKQENQELIEDSGHGYDKITVSGNNVKGDIYFNVDILLNWINKRTNPPK